MRINRVRSYEEMVEAGDWPPTNKQTALFVVGLLIGGFIGWSMTYVYFLVTAA